MTYGEQRDWADKFIPEARRVILLILNRIVDVRIAPEHEDRLTNTDLIVDRTNWGFRVRRPDCGWRDFTVRAVLHSGGRTELAKIKDGHGDHHLVAWTTEQSAKHYKFSEWAAIDLDSFRDKLPVLERLASKETNGPNDSGFLAWPIGVLLEHGVSIQRKLASP